MKLEILRILFDFGLFILIWLVQLVIYPSFQFYQKESLIKWHKKYTIGISLVVIPLMVGQLIASILQLFYIQNTFTIGSLVLITIAWVVTFSQFVPMHGKIAAGIAGKILLEKLAKRNWLRTLVWTVLFIWTFLVSL